MDTQICLNGQVCLNNQVYLDSSKEYILRLKAICRDCLPSCSKRNKSDQIRTGNNFSSRVPSKRWNTEPRPARDCWYRYGIHFRYRTMNHNVSTLRPRDSRFLAFSSSLFLSCILFSFPLLNHNRNLDNKNQNYIHMRYVKYTVRDRNSKENTVALAYS